MTREPSTAAAACARSYASTWCSSSRATEILPFSLDVLGQRAGGGVDDALGEIDRGAGGTSGLSDISTEYEARRGPPNPDYADGVGGVGGVVGGGGVAGVVVVWRRGRRCRRVRRSWFA